MSKPYAPDRIMRRAAQVRAQWQAGNLHARRTYRGRYLTLKVTHQWRLLSKDDGRHWELLSHADYSNQL